MYENINEKLGISRKPQIEQAMDWLVEHGPIHQAPALPAWMLHHLVRMGRIARLRRGLYLVPETGTGAMLPLPVVAARLAPEGYLSFYGALTLHGLTDQDAARWGIVGKEKQALIRYGRQRLEFVPWPARLTNAEKTRWRIDRWTIRLATPVQAFCDTLEAPRLGPGWAELIHVLQTGLSTKHLRAGQLRARARHLDSVVLARRLGLLLELTTGEVDRDLEQLARRSHNWTTLGGKSAPRRITRDTRWRLLLPHPREEMLLAARE